jgi:lysozyme
MAASDKARAAALIAAALAAPAEGLRQWAYKDPVGILTVCYGTTGKDVVQGKQYTIGECKALLARDMLDAVEKVESCAPGAPEPVLVAFGDAAYNIGPKVACDTQHSTAARKLAAKDWKGACQELPKWNRATKAGVSVELPGLTKRRAMEADYCLKGLS